MELIQNWTDEQKQLLKQFILSYIDCKCNDVIIGGSRIFGGYRPGSDIDVLVPVHADIKKNTLHLLFGSVKNDEFILKNFRINISTISDAEFVYGSFKNNGYTYDMPWYSLLNNELHSGNMNHVLHHQRLRKLIIDRNGIDVPFEQFALENDYLLNLQNN